MTYVIKVDESLLDVLNRFGIELEDLLKFNNLNGIMIQPGSKLQIPVKKEPRENEEES